MEIKVGDMVEALINFRDTSKGKLYKVTKVDDSEISYIDNVGDKDSGDSSKFKLTKRNGKAITEDLTKFMAYGTGCDNRSRIYTTEKELKENLKKFAKDGDWTGRIIGYKLVPILEAVTETRLKVFKKPVVKKIKK